MPEKEPLNAINASLGESVKKLSEALGSGLRFEPPAGLNDALLASRNLSGEISRMHRMQAEAVAEKAEREERYKQSVLGALRGIEQNTALLADMVELLQHESEHSDELMGFLSEALHIGAAKTNEEAKSRYRAFMDRVNRVVEDADTMSRLANYAMMVLNIVKNISHS